MMTEPAAQATARRKGFLQTSKQALRCIPPLLLFATASGGAQSPERRFAISGFDAVELASADAVRIVPGGEFAVTAGGDPVAIASLLVERSGGTLHVGRMPGTHRDRGALVTIVMPMLSRLSLLGSGSIRADRVAGLAFDARVGGSGRMEVTGVRSKRLTVVVGGSGSFAADGGADEVKVDLSGSGRVDLRRLDTPTIEVDSRGSGSVAARATRTAKVRAGGSGDVRVDGGARCAVSRNGSASVRCA